MSSNPDYDRWYAARKVRILLSPSHRLETFGNTLVNYHLISELDDHPGKIRVREGLWGMPHIFRMSVIQWLGDTPRGILWKLGC